jgi:hypothetical protein
MNILIYLLAVYGATNILVASKITKPFRQWISDRNTWLGYLVNCFMCTGFWMGIALFLCGLKFNLDTRVDWLILGCAGSGWCWIVRVVLNKLDEDSL